MEGKGWTEGGGVLCLLDLRKEWREECLTLTLKGFV